MGREEGVGERAGMRVRERRGEFSSEPLSVLFHLCDSFKRNSFFFPPFPLSQHRKISIPPSRVRETTKATHFPGMIFTLSACDAA